MTMTLIETKTLGTAAASIEFTSIPQTFTDLVVLVSGRTDRADAIDSAILRFNGDTNSANYTGRRLLSQSSTGVSDTFVNATALAGATATANTFGNLSFYIPNYTGATNKSFGSDGVTENNSAAEGSFRLILTAGLWNDTDSITSLNLLPSIGLNLLAGSSVSLYGILKGSDGIVTTS